MSEVTINVGDILLIKKILPQSDDKQLMASIIFEKDNKLFILSGAYGEGMFLSDDIELFSGGEG